MVLIGSSIAQLLGGADEGRRVFLASGVAGGITATFNALMAGMLFAADIMIRNVPCLSPDNSFETAFEVFEAKQISTLPVVDPVNPHKVRWILKKSSLLLAYNQKILKTDLLNKITS